MIDPKAVLARVDELCHDSNVFEIPRSIATVFQASVIAMTEAINAELGDENLDRLVRRLDQALTRDLAPAPLPCVTCGKTFAGEDPCHCFEGEF